MAKPVLKVALVMVVPGISVADFLLQHLTVRWTTISQECISPCVKGVNGPKTIWDVSYRYFDPS